jgi:hypothetical protein
VIGNCDAYKFGMRMHETKAFRTEVRDVLEKYNPLNADCMSKYDKVIVDLLRSWQYDDEPSDIKGHLKNLFVYHWNRMVVINDELVTELFTLRYKYLK